MMSRNFRTLFPSSRPVELGTNQLKADDFFIPHNANGVATYLMPPNPSNLDMIAWAEGPVGFDVNKVVFQINDRPIMNLNQSYEITTKGAGGRMIYFSILGYWKVYLDTEAVAVDGGTPPVVNVINQAVLTSPANEQIELTSILDLTCSAFNTTPAAADTLLRYEWVTASDVDFTNLYWSGSSTTNQVQVGTLIPSGSRVYVRVRFVGQNTGAGPWSDPVTFVIDAVSGPTSVSITGAQLASGGTTHQFTIVSSAYSGSNTHVASQFQVLNAAGAVVYDSNEVAGAVLTHKPFDFNFRPTNLTDYTARVRYKLNTGQWSTYTSTSVRTGNGSFTSINTTFQTSYYSDRPYNHLTSWYTAGGSNNPYGLSGPYHICYAGDGISGDSEWVCDPANPLVNAPSNFTLAHDGYPSIGGPYPRTVTTTQYITSDRVSYNTSRSTQRWTEW